MMLHETFFVSIFKVDNDLVACITWIYDVCLIVLTFDTFNFSSATLAVFNSSVSKPRRPVHYSNVNCHGTESKLWDCKHHRYYYVTGLPSVTHQNTEVAGVNCQS